MVKTDIYFDAENELLCIRSIDATGAVIDTLPQVRIQLSDLQYAAQVSGLPIEAYLRRVHYADLSGAKKRCYGLFTIPEDDSTDDGHSSSTEDLYLGGSGGGGLRQCQITSLFVNDYIGVRYFDGATQSGSEFKVAKDPLGRMPPTVSGTPTEIIDSVTLTYPTRVAENKRTSYDGTNTETQVCYPRYTVGQVVWVEPVDYSGVVYGGSDIKVLEVKPGRIWIRQYLQP